MNKKIQGPTSKIQIKNKIRFELIQKGSDPSSRSTMSYEQILAIALSSPGLPDPEIEYVANDLDFN